MYLHYYVKTVISLTEQSTVQISGYFGAVRDQTTNLLLYLVSYSHPQIMLLNFIKTQQD